MELIEDSYILGNLSADKMSLADLEGRRTGSLVDGWVLKKRMLSFLLDELLPITLGVQEDHPGGRPERDNLQGEGGVPEAVRRGSDLASRVAQVSGHVYPIGRGQVEQTRV